MLSVGDLAPLYEVEEINIEKSFDHSDPILFTAEFTDQEIGRASCRERV